MAEQQAHNGTGECCWTPLGVEQVKIHRKKRMKSVPKTARRRSADELQLIATAAAWREVEPITGRVNVA
jgi:hypothetical protein